MGAPWVKGIEAALREKLVFSRYNFYEQYIEDVDEFSKVKQVPNDIDWSPMGRILEGAFKLNTVQIRVEATFLAYFRMPNTESSQEGVASWDTTYASSKAKANLVAP
jgi:hypothetical protein